MRSLIPLIAGAALVATGAAQAAPREAPEAKLAKMIEGRVAGEPVDCINLRNVRSSRIIDDTAIVYDAGGTLYVNRPTAGRESLDQHDTLVTKTHSTQLCSIDVVQLYDTGSRMNSGTVFLGKFIPHKRVKTRQRD
ncbi:hypothetical protein [Sphingosinicella rhizophila]|uniref:Uncharacterized protein n=1 Tax=Sphingosinicella rhizophila TaxID=3050082 RepID=A0ABU3Q6D1_9SPHN|nr:hypothetical protein [Sphingosinicella sp. GR2756]MDT9598961.1 hypothetical protein [Sphingosinicella sp. GR2756]